MRPITATRYGRRKLGGAGSISKRDPQNKNPGGKFMRRGMQGPTEGIRKIRPRLLDEVSPGVKKTRITFSLNHRVRWTLPSHLFS